MIPTDPLISSKSEYYFYFPSVTARETFFYSICAGHFIYRPGYLIRRSSYDSFLLMYIQDGSLTVEYDDCSVPVSKGAFVLLDCYAPHSYHSRAGCECIWCHFDGPMARNYYDLIVSHLGHVFSLPTPYPAASRLQDILEVYASGPIHEALISKYLTDVCTFFLTSEPRSTAINPGAIQMTVSYINEHFSEPLIVEKLSEHAGLSPYHFIRLFRRETGFTPHEYLLNTRINAARYMLRCTKFSIKSICFATGFSSESVFCTAFKRHIGKTPKSYRETASHGEETE